MRCVGCGGVGLQVSHLEEQLGLGGERQARHGRVALDAQGCMVQGAGCGVGCLGAGCRVWGLVCGCRV